MSATQLTRYSIGIAAENKPLNSRKLNVLPTEILSALDGEVNFAPQDQTHVGRDADGNRYEVKTTTDNTITAEWLPLSSNRVTPPDIRRGELIELYRVADSDQFFWRCMGLRDDLRRLETVIYAFNASPDEGAKGIDPATCYFLEISTHKKTITLGTSQANGEPFGYNLQIDTGGGKVVLEDTIGNSLFLDSGRVFWELINADGTYLQLDRTNIYGFADQNIEFRAGNDVYWEAGQNVTVKAGNDILYQAGTSLTTEAPETTFKADTITGECPNSTFTGNVNVGGNLGVAGGITAGTGGGSGQTMTINGDTHMTGDIEVTGTLRVDRVVATTSVTAPNL